MDKLQHYRGYIVLTLVYALLFGGYVLYERWPQPEPIQIITPTPWATHTPAPLQVHVAGAVYNPGVYTLPAGSRLVQAVEAAGGLTGEADREGINLADPLQDGRRVYIPRRGSPTPPPPTAVSAAPNTTTAGTEGDLVNINTATAAELETLPEIGPVLAERIIAYRQSEGPFTAPEQLMKVNGIGEATFAKLKARITLR